jgi:DNA polymerase elongation subunit (family B)
MAGVKTEKFEGAFVKAPQIGKFPWIVSFDATSLYPSIMMMLNVGPDTIINQKLLDVDIEDMVETRQNPHQTMLQDNDWCMGANGACFRNDIKGFLPTIVEHVFNKRQAYKAKMLDAERQYKETGDDKWKAVESRYNTMQSATKVSANSAYGVMGSPHFRFFDTRVAEAVTKTGQLIITWAADTLNRYLNELGGTTGKDFVIMADTDSVYVNLSSFVPKDIKDPQLIADFLSGVEVTKGKREGGFVREHINPLFAKTFDELKAQINAKVQKIHMKQESVVLSGIFVAKKKYCMAVIESEGGLRKDKPDTVVKGIELVRSDTPILCKSSMKKAIDIMLLGKEDDLHELVADFYQKFKVAPYQDISYPTGINGLTDYKGEGDAIYAKGCPIHVRAALLHNYYVKKKGLSREYQPIRDKDKIKYVYLKMPNPFAENVIGYADAIPKEFDLEKYIDRILMFDKSFINPIKRVTDAFGWTPEPVNSLF